MPIAKGRMIRVDISKSKKFASLSPNSQRLFVMIIPHINSFGKMEGQPAFIQGKCVPLLRDMTIKKIVKCLAEISEKTNMKWFEHEGLHYIHCLSWKEHQELREKRLGFDTLPNYSRSIPGIIQPEVEVEVEVKDKTNPLPGGESFDVLASFEKVWKFYPRPLGKKAAFAHFKKSIESKDDLKRIAAALDNYIAHIEAKKTEEKFIQHGSTWFNNWGDWENYNGEKK